MRLGEKGCTHEMGVLFRTIDDFVDEILFLLEKGEEGAKAKERFVEEFFSAELLSSEELMKLERDRPRTSKRKIRAGQARHINPQDPHTLAQMAFAADHVGEDMSWQTSWASQP